MNLKELFNKSTYGSIGYISSQSDLDLLETYIVYNLPVLREFKQVVVATNYGIDLQVENTKLWEKYFPNITLIDSPNNRGHNFGTADLDNLIFNWCKNNSIDWLCKSANDIILQDSLLQKKVEDADFYYLNGIGFGGMVKYEFNNERIINEDFYPQTNFYLIDVSKVDYLNNKIYLDETFSKIKSIVNYNGKIWEYFKGWSCEDFLKNAIERNNLIKFHLIPQKSYITLLETIKSNNIHDCSHKNIMVEGICHFQYPNQQVIQI